MTLVRRSALASAALLFGIAPALAQTGTAPAPTSGGAAPGATMTQVPAGTADPCGPGGQQGNLSGKLADCNGVITPPATGDGDIHQAAPDPTPNSTPVIKPQTGGTVAK